MPFISVKTSAKLSMEQKIEIKSRLGKLIEILPTKTEKGLMVDIMDDRTMFHAGEQNDGIVFVDVRLMGKSPDKEKEEFVVAVTDMLHEVANTNVGNTYINYLEMMQWGSRGKFSLVKE